MYNGRYYEFTFWSPMLGLPALRLSMADENGDEHFAIIAADEPGRKLRDAKAAALSQIATHIAGGRKSGEVKVEPLVEPKPTVAAA